MAESGGFPASAGPNRDRSTLLPRSAAVGAPTEIEYRDMPRQAPSTTRPLRRAAAAGLAAVLVSAPGLAADIQPHGATYQITVEKPPADTALDGQASVTLQKTCEAWSFSSALFYTIERNARRGQAGFSDKADNYQERINFTEKLDGTTLQYTARYQPSGRGEEVRGTIKLGEDGAGTLDVKSDRLPRTVKLPPETRLPIALRARLIDGLPRDDKVKPTVNTRGVEIVRFHVDADLTLTVAPPLAPAKTAKGDVIKLPEALTKGRSWTLNQTSKALSDWMESTFELHESGVISRFTFKRDGIVWRADAKELNTFTPPKCSG